MRIVMRLLAAAKHAAVVLGALALISAPAEVRADGPNVLGDEFALLLKGIYKPVVRGPELGLSLVDLDDGTYAKCKIYRSNGLPGTTHRPVGNFYVNFDVTLCAYQLPAGAFAAAFTEFVYEDVFIDGQHYQVGTAELVIEEATGIYEAYVGGSIHMRFRTHVIDDVTFDEYCFCDISR